jgi:glycosyltransferase involved in cell wall biosynthesis
MERGAKECDKPLISIITPTFNHEKYIAECIESVLCQTYTNWEMIIIDDCSTDNTVDIVKSYMDKDQRIKLIRHNHNYGPLALDKTYNEALSIAKGEWIAILEGDDVWPHYRLERQINIIKHLPKDVVLLHGNVGYIHEDLEKVTLQRYRVSLIKTEPFNLPYEAFDYLIYGYNPIYSQTALIKKEALEKVGEFIQDPKEIRLVDFPTWLRLSKVGRFYKDTYILGFWRRHGSSITMNNQDKIAINYETAIKNFLSKNGIQFNNECVGKLQYFGAIVQTAIKKDFEKAKVFLDELLSFVKSGKLPVNKSSKYKLFIYKIIITTKQPWILEYLYKLKRTKLDVVIGTYEPFFFKKEEFVKRLDEYNKRLTEPFVSSGGNDA